MRQEIKWQISCDDSQLQSTQQTRKNETGRWWSWLLNAVKCPNLGVRLRDNSHDITLVSYVRKLEEPRRLNQSNSDSSDWIHCMFQLLHNEVFTLSKLCLNYSHECVSIIISEFPHGGINKGFLFYSIMQRHQSHHITEDAHRLNKKNIILNSLHNSLRLFFACNHNVSQAHF